jgi:hypothetical protein
MSDRGAGPSARRIAPWAVLAGIGVGTLVLAELGQSWLWNRVRAQAALRGVQLEGCSLELGFSALGLQDCEFSLESDGPPIPWALGEARVGGKIADIELELESLVPARVRVRGADVVMRGDPPWLDWVNGVGSTASSPELSSAELPLEVTDSRVSWAPGPHGAPALSLTGIRYSSTARQGGAAFATRNGWRGELLADASGVQLTLGSSQRPKARLRVHADATGRRAEFALQLHAFGLEELQGSWLSVPEGLRGATLDGQILAAIPIGLATDVPGGDAQLTLQGLQFPVPRELDGLPHGSPPRISGKFTLSRALDRASFRDLDFQTGDLDLHGQVRLERAGEGLSLQANFSGPLSCAAIVESAARARPGSPLAEWGKRLGQSRSSGSVEIAAAIRGNTAELEHALVVKSIGVGCGLEPLPLDADVPRELIDRLPEAIRQRLPRFERLPDLHLPAPARTPDNLQLPRLPGLNLPSPSRGREPTASG